MSCLSLLTLAGYLAVATLPRGATVVVEDRFVGESPLVAACPAGTTWVRLEHDWGGSFFKAETTLSLVVREGETTGVAVAWAAPVYLDSKPQGASVTVNGRHAGMTPFVLRGLRPGTRRFSLSQAGCRDTTFHLTLSVRDPVSLLFQMDCGERLDARHSAKPRLVFAGGALLSLGTGLAAWVIHREADESYESYLDTADPNAMEDYYRRARRLDRTAATLWIVSLSSFLASVLWSALVGGV